MNTKKIIQNIFSIKNNNEHKTLTIIGIKLKFRSKKLILRNKLQQKKVLETKIKKIKTNIKNIRREILNKTIKLYFDHSLGGGTETYFNNQIKNLTDDIAILRIQYYIYTTKYKISCYKKGASCLNLGEFDLENLYQILNRLELKTIIVSNLVAYPNVYSILKFITEYKINNTNTTVIVKGHDFYSICPEWNLLDSENICCTGKCSKQKYLKCHKKFQLRCNDIKEDTKNDNWQRHWGDFYKNTVDKLEVFAPSGINIFLNVYPFLKDKIMLIPHTIKPFPKYHVAILGHLTVHKGSDIINNIVEYLTANDINDIHFIVIGQNASNIKSDLLSTYGEYSRNLIPEILKNNNIDAIFIPSIWHETFSYTTGEAISLEYPVISFNLGGQADQVRNYKKGKILSSFEPEIIVNEIIEFIEQTKGKCEHETI